MLTDENLHWLKHLPSPKTPPDVVQSYLAFACGIIRGALANLGITSTITADTTFNNPTFFLHYFQGVFKVT